MNMNDLVRLFLLFTFGIYKYKKAVLSQGNRAMPQLFFSVLSSPTFTTSLTLLPATVFATFDGSGGGG